jgi:hypothetical protein
MLELGGNELAGHFRRLIAADSRLGIPFQLVRRDVHSLPMCLAHLVIAADKSGQRYRLGRAEGRIPPGAVFDRRDGLAVLCFVFMDLAMANQLFAGRWVLAFGEPGELLGSHCTGKVELSGQFAVPLPLNRVGLFPIVLFGCGEFLFVIGLGLTRGKRFGDGQHSYTSTSQDQVLLIVRVGSNGWLGFNLLHHGQRVGLR